MNEHQTQNSRAASVKVEVDVGWDPLAPNSPYDLCGRKAVLNE